jgi:hypothetical protein
MATPGIAGTTPVLTIPNHNIENLDSFIALTSGSRQVAGLYFYMLLDCLVDTAWHVALDFFRRPHLYTGLGTPAIPPVLAKLHARIGTDERIPSKQQRVAILAPLFGTWRGYSESDTSNFPRLRDELLCAASAFAERVYDTGEDMLRERVRTTHRPFKEYLTGLEGESLAWSREQAFPEITEAISYKILRHEGVAAVFGIKTPPRAQWPYKEDSNGDKLIEEISSRLVSGETAAPILREQASNLQRAALRGAEALATIIDFSEGGTKGDIDLLILKCYSWASALKAVRG